MENRTEIRVLKIFHTADIHGRFCQSKLERVQALIGTARGEELTSVILVDSGDALFGSNTFWLPWEPAISKMNELRYLAGAIGNREFHYIYTLYKIRERAYKFDLLSANLMTPKGEPIRSHLIAKVDALTLCLIGLTPVQYSGSSFLTKLFGWTFIDPLEATDSTVSKPECRRADLIIILSHLGIDLDRRLSDILPENSIILGGHSHITCSERVNRVIIGHPGAYLENIGIAELIFKLEGTNYRLLNSKYELIKL